MRLAAGDAERGVRAMIDPRAIPIFLRPTTVPHLTLGSVQRFIEGRTVLRAYELDRFVNAVFANCRALGLNPDVMLGMSNLETDRWRSARWSTGLNPAGLGATDDGAAGNGFPDGRTAALAMGVHLMAYARGHDNDFAKVLHLDTRFLAVHMAGRAGRIRTVAGLGNGNWATDLEYPTKVCARIQEMS